MVIFGWSPRQPQDRTAISSDRASLPVMVGRVEIAGLARGNRICREGERNEQKRIHRRFGRRRFECLIGNNLGWSQC